MLILAHNVQTCIYNVLGDINFASLTISRRLLMFARVDIARLDMLENVTPASSKQA